MQRSPTNKIEEKLMSMQDIMLAQKSLNELLPEEKSFLFDFYSKIVVKVIKKKNDKNVKALSVCLKELEELRERYK